jgi:hypothetical protein
MPTSLVILADSNPRWRPKAYQFCGAASSIRFEYAICKLTEVDLAPWIAAGNPVARVIEAHRMAQGTGRDMKARRIGKLGVVRQLLESGMSDAEIREVMRLVHWLLALPEEEEIEFRKDVRHMEASMETKRRSTYERIVWEEGRHSASQDLLLDLVIERFGHVTPDLRARVEHIRDEARLRQLARAVLTIPTLAELASLVDG